ncbi:PAS domain S-box protein [uncultured Lamprocystis sp.]|jgi:PAS domain S-box-containing protein|uniref:PAS domain S-box protein n=1 Tax=uncultured Lamprocystis sp. TaxID=543132 RepID=UPI0025F7A5C1|nr:PAS domain S-box protein [uncultured Lamprocystis sp.]
MDNSMGTARPPTADHRRLLTLGLAAAAIAGNYFSLPLFFGVDILFGSIAVLLTLARLGTGAGLAVALAGGAYTWLLWDHPYALIILVAEAAAIGWHRERARRRGRTPPPLAVSATLYWLLIGIPLVVLCYRFGLEIGWTATLLIAFKQALNGILNAAIAGLLLIGAAHLRRRQPGLPLAEVLFGVLLAGMLGSTLLITSWENLGLKEHLETTHAKHLQLAGQLTLDQLAADRAAGGADATGLPAPLQQLGEHLTELLLAAANPQVRLESGPLLPAAAPTLGKRPQPGQRIPTADPELFLMVPDEPTASRMVLWSQARYRMDLPVTTASLPNQRLVMEFSAAPLIHQVQLRVMHLLAALLTLALLGVAAAYWLSGRIVTPLRRLAERTQTLSTAIGDDQPWEPPPPGLLTETRQLTQAVAEMARSLAAGFQTLRQERDRREQTEHRLNAIVESSPHGIVEANPLTWRLLWCSGSMLRLFGYTAAEWNDQCLTMEDLHPAESLPLVRSEYTRIAGADPAPALDLPCRRRDGSIFYCKLSPGLARIGNDATLVAFFTDVTPEYQARRAVERTRTALLKAQEIAKLGSWELDIAAGELSWSPEVFRIFEQEPQDFTPSYAALLAAIHPDDRPMVERAYWDALAKRTPYDLIHRLLLPSGQIKWVHDCCESEVAADGRPLKSHGTIQDITARKLAELAVRQREAMVGELLALAAEFVKVPDQDILALTERAITRIGRFSQAERSYYFRLDTVADTLCNTIEWTAEGITPMIGNSRAIPLTALPALMIRLRAGAPAVIHRVADLPATWSNEQALFRAQNIQSLLVVPLIVEETLLGCIGFDAVRHPRDWSEVEVHFLQVFASVLAGAMERARATAELRASNTRYDELARQSRAIAWEVDAQGRYTYVSPVCEAVLGYRPAELVGTCYDTLFAPEHQASVKAAALEVFARKAPFKDFTNCCRTRDGEQVWLLTNGTPLLADDGSLLGYRGMDADITERYLAQDRIKESEGRLAAIFDNAPIGMTLVGPDRRIMLTNRALAAFLGRTAEELIGIPFDDVTHPADRDRDIAEFSALTAGRQTGYRMTKRYLHPDGRIVWGDLRVALLPTRPGEPPLPLRMVEDITELHAATERQQVLEDAMARYAAQLEQLVDLISLPHPASEQVRALLRLGYQALGMTAAVLGIVDEAHGHLTLTKLRDDAPTGAIPDLSRALLAETLAERGSPCQIAPERLPPAATAAGFSCGILMAFDGTRPDGSHATLTLALWGFQRHPQLQEPERQIIRLIAQRIASVRRQEQVQRDLMEAREREAIGHLASGVAHDFNNLLGVIGANIYYLDACLVDQCPVDPEVRQVLEETQSALGHAKVVTSGILALSRGGRVPLEVVDLGRTIAELEHILRHILPSGIALRVTVAPGLTAWSNSAFLQSALLNLVLNARDAMADGGILSIQARPHHWEEDTPLAVGHLAAMDCVDLSVSDTGSGIAPAILPRIFDPLFSTKAARRGHGLGLFMVQEFIARSGAGLAVQSRLHAGACFRLLLPREPSAADPRPDSLRPAALPGPAERSGAPSLAGLRVLVVDDDPQIREALARLLTLEGASLVLAEHGQACSDLLEQDGAFDLVLSDIAMPVLDGIRLQQRLARERPELPVILMTGQQPVLGDAHAGAEPPLILRKPLDAATLRAAILQRCVWNT